MHQNSCSSLILLLMLSNLIQAWNWFFISYASKTWAVIFSLRALQGKISNAYLSCYKRRQTKRHMVCKHPIEGQKTKYSHYCKRIREKSLFSKKFSTYVKRQIFTIDNFESNIFYQLFFLIIVFHGNWKNLVNWTELFEYNFILMIKFRLFNI